MQNENEKHEFFCRETVVVIREMYKVLSEAENQNCFTCFGTART